MDGVLQSPDEDTDFDVLIHTHTHTHTHTRVYLSDMQTHLLSTYTERKSSQEVP